MGRTYQLLSVEERIELQLQREKSMSVRAIARTLMRTASTVSRELRRNGCHLVLRKRSIYSTSEAQQRAVHLSGNARVERKLVPGTAAGAAVVEQFACGLSPEQAARTLRRMHPENP